MKNMIRLATPSTNLIRSYIADFDSDLSYSAPDRALSSLFEKYPSNSNLEDVLLKVSALNSLYSTNIFAVVDAAKHIQSIELDGALTEGLSSAVELVASMELGGKHRRNYSFATKYCSWHNPQSYPIYDTYVDSLLWTYKLRDGFSDFRRGDLRFYKDFKAIIQVFMQHYALEDFTFKELDKSMWLYGRSIFAAS